MKFIELSNSDKKILVKFRLFKPNEAEILIKCIKDEYGDSYFKRDFYNPEYLKHAAESGHIKFLVAQLDNGEIIGMMALKRFLPQEDMCEIASEIFLKKYRGFKMAYPFFRYALREIHRMKNVSAIYCLPVVFHDISQKLMERIQLEPCGFIFGVFLMPEIQHSYKFDENIKQPQGVMIRKLCKKDAGKIYLPLEYNEIAKNIYDSLGVKYQIENKFEKLIGKSEIIFENEEIQYNCKIEVRTAGADLIERLEKIQAQFAAQYQTFNVFLNISDPKSIAAYHELTKIGYFFTGFQPLCSEREIMILHNPQNLTINMQTLSLTPKFRVICDYIEKCYIER